MEPIAFLISNPGADVDILIWNPPDNFPNDKSRLLVKLSALDKAVVIPADFFDGKYTLFPWEVQIPADRIIGWSYFPGDEFP